MKRSFLLPIAASLILFSLIEVALYLPTQPKSAEAQGGYIINWGSVTFSGCNHASPTSITASPNANTEIVSFDWYISNNYTSCDYWTNNVTISGTYGSGDHIVTKFTWLSTTIGNTGWCSSWGCSPTWPLLKDQIGRTNGYTIDSQGGSPWQSTVDEYYFISPPDNHAVGSFSLGLRAPDTNPGTGTYHFEVEFEIQSIGGMSLYPTATPTPTPTSFGGSFNLCLTATPAVSATVPATPTPWIARTSTPGGPTPTRTNTPTRTATGGPPAATATAGPPSWQQIEWSSVATFTTSLQPWTEENDLACAGCVIARTQYTDTIGDDGQPGIAILGKGLEYDNMTGTWGTNTPWLYGTDPTTSGHWQDMLVLSLPTDIMRPINISGYAKTLRSMVPGNTAWIQVWYLDDGVPGCSVCSPWWVSRASYNVQISYDWQQWGIRITPEDFGHADTFTGHTRAVAISWFTRNVSSNPTTEDLDIVSASQAMLVDDLNVTIGDAADSMLPVCAPGYGSTTPMPGGYGPTPIPHKMCLITYNNIDVYSACIQPTDLLDLGGWISWAWCRISRFFQWLQENSKQVTALQQRQNANEPIGSLNEISSIVGSLTTTLSEMQQMNRPAAQSPLDFVNLFNVSALDHPALNLYIPDTANTDYITQCPAAIASRGQSFSYGACWAIFSLRNTIAVTLMQWILNAAFLVGLVRFIYGVAKSIAN